MDNKYTYKGIKTIYISAPDDNTNSSVIFNNVHEIIDNTLSHDNLCEPQDPSQNESDIQNTYQKRSHITPTIYMINEYIYISATTINTDYIKDGCMQLNNLITELYKNEDPSFIYTKSIPTRLFHTYNLLTYPFPEFYNLYKKIQEVFYDVYRHRNKCNDIPPHYIQCWLNIVYKHDNLDWHSHWASKHNSWHGYIYVDVQSSVPATLYKIPDYPNIITIYGKNGNMVISPSDGDMHKTVKWMNDSPRISIAFDILPSSSVPPNEINHWIPI